MPNLTQPACPVLAEFNPFEPAQTHDPYPMYTRAREQAPIFFSPVLNMWVVTRYEDICEIARDTTRFSNRRAVDVVAEIPAEVLAIFTTSNTQPQFIVEIDPPTHTRVRRLANKAFTPRRVTLMEPRIRALANGLADMFAHEGRADLMAQFAYQLPRMVIADIVGVPAADIPKFGQWSEAWATYLFTVDLPLEQQIQGARSAVALQNYCEALIEERRHYPQDDLLSDLVQAQEEDGTSLSLNELVGLIMTFLIAGHLTTSDMIGNALVLLLKQPELWQALCREPQLATRLIEETLRRDSSVPGLMRVATEDVTFNGVSIPKGARLFLAFGSANHDETVFPEPTRFDLERENLYKHLAFGQGIHYCLGAPVARLEGKVALEVLSQRLPSLRFQPGQTVTYRPNLVFRGPDQLPLMWDKEKLVNSEVSRVTIPAGSQLV
jgi:cytochrome P450